MDLDTSHLRLEMDLDALLWALLQLGSPKDSHLKYILIEASILKFMGISNPFVPQEFLLTVVLVYHTVGLYNLDEDWGIETVILVVLALTIASQVPRYQFDRDPRFCSAGIPMVGVLRR